ncbi:MAG TPA: ABC transporter permease [Niabella sp.]|nr:ABC transporter permease [Niabella sp.]HOZ96646.1 ABC transporter permease [Niabella sp.]HQW14486.1 ABC transporter permease [Niabella sp.]HQX19901.1 ABC transporter permease [Niabella sp.]HQX41508.1 ABC transporter permease [Niabella sp.]
MIKLTIKDLRLFFKDKRAVLLTFALPILLITLFAFAFGGVGKNKKESKVSMQISDLDNSQASGLAVGVFDSLERIQSTFLPLNEAQENIKKGKKSCVLVIHKGFSDSLAAGKTLPLELQFDEANEIEVGLLQQSLIPTVSMLPFKIGDPKIVMGNRFSSIIPNSDTGLKKDIQLKSDDLFEDVARGMTSSNESNLAASFFGDLKMTKLVAAKEDNNLGLVQAVAGTAIMMLLFAVVGIGSSILEEKQEGTLKRLLYTPMNPLGILFGKMVYANTISILQLTVMFLFAAIVFGLNIFSHLGSLMVTILATAFACSAFGVFLASFSKSRQQVQGLSTLIVLVMSAIGGSMIPIFFMPPIMQKAAILSVNYWSIQAFYDIFWRDLSFFSATFLTRILILLLIGSVLNGLAIYMFKKNILKLT